MIRSPNLSNLFYKAECKRLNEDALQKVYESSVFTLRQYQYDVKNVDWFVEQVFDTVTGQVADLNFVATRETDSTQKSPQKQSAMPNRKDTSKMLSLSKIVAQVNKKREALLSPS